MILKWIAVKAEMKMAAFVFFVIIAIEYSVIMIVRVFVMDLIIDYVMIGKVSIELNEIKISGVDIGSLAEPYCFCILMLCLFARFDFMNFFCISIIMWRYPQINSIIFILQNMQFS